VPVPGGLLRSSVLIGGKVWDGRDPLAYISSFGGAGERPVFGHGAPQ
jgi:hypothetical protein